MWRIKPTIIEELIPSATYVVYFDENGDADMTYIRKCKNNQTDVDEFSRYFGLTSVLLNHHDIGKVKKDIQQLKEKHWKPDGCYDYGGKSKMVCLHSREIRKQIGPFSKKAIDQNEFFKDINDLMSNLPISITTSFIDKYELNEKYGSFAQSPYDLSITFILERLVKSQLKDSDKVIIILESRGKKEDAALLDTINRILKYGTSYVSSKQFQKIIGVYFNPKRCPSNCKKSYYGLEIADLCAYPIFKFCRSGKEDKAYNMIKSKIYNYPHCYGYGIKMFP